MFRRRPIDELQTTVPSALEGTVAPWSGADSSSTEYLRERVRILERQVEDLKSQMTSKVRLEDLDRGELATAAIGAAGEIVRAAHAQADELIREAEDLRRNAMEESRDLFAKSRATSEQMVQEAESRAKDALATSQREIEQREVASRSDAQRRLDEAQRSADSIVASAQDEARRIVTTAEQRRSEADLAAAATVKAAQTTADRTIAEGNAFFSSILSAAGEALAMQRKTLGEVNAQSQSMRQSMEQAIGVLRTSLEGAVATLSSSEARADSSMLRIEQFHSEMETMRSNVRPQAMAAGDVREVEPTSTKAKGARKAITPAENSSAAAQEIVEDPNAELQGTDGDALVDAVEEA